jgi:DNA-binding PadR family transcriptional regulator
MRATTATMQVVRCLAAHPVGWRYGYDLLAETGLKSGSLYPILIRLAGRGLLEATWEQDAPPGRPPRHLYRLTSTGRAWLRSIEATRPHRGNLQPGLAG